MTIADDLGRKATEQTNKQTNKQREKGKNQESMQSSTIPDPEHHMGK